MKNDEGIGTRRILIADDNGTCRYLLRTILEASGYTVAEAADGRAALDQAMRFRPHLVILDIQMPDIDGCTAAIVLRRMQPFRDTPIVALTASPGHSIPDEVLHPAFSTYLLKPISPARLRSLVANALIANPLDQQAPAPSLSSRFTAAG